MNKTANEIHDYRDKLLIVMELVKQNIGKKYLNQVIDFLDDLAEEAPKTKKPTKKAAKKRHYVPYTIDSNQAVV